MYLINEDFFDDNTSDIIDINDDNDYNEVNNVSISDFECKLSVLIKNETGSFVKRTIQYISSAVETFDVFSSYYIVDDMKKTNELIIHFNINPSLNSRNLYNFGNALYKYRSLYHGRLVYSFNVTLNGKKHILIGDTYQTVTKYGGSTTKETLISTIFLLFGHVNDYSKLVLSGRIKPDDIVNHFQRTKILEYISSDICDYKEPYLIFYPLYSVQCLGTTIYVYETKWFDYSSAPGNIYLNTTGYTINNHFWGSTEIKSDLKNIFQIYQSKIPDNCISDKVEIKESNKDKPVRYKCYMSYKSFFYDDNEIVGVLLYYSKK